MDRKECMIVDLDKRGSKDMFVTERIAAIKENSKGLWSVLFNGSTRWFHYNPSRLLYLTHPEKIDLGEKGLYINNRHITQAAALLRFSDEKHCFYHIVYQNGYYENLEGKQVYVTRTPINQNGGSTWDYLNKLAAETSLLTDDNDSILSKQYQKVDVKRDNVPLAQYLGSKSKLDTHTMPKQLYYPFGCNASQKAAVEAALTHQVSIIQGPPGTGKTQTILNIIANLLMQNKTVLVVSNNNSAVENVAEKLEKESLGFIVAQLGSAQNRDVFFNNQPSCPAMDNWLLEDKSAVKERCKKALAEVSKGFEGQLQQAKLQAEHAALQLEREHNEKLCASNESEGWLRNRASSSLLKLLHSYQLLNEGQKAVGIWYKLKWSLRMGMRMFSFLKKPSSRVVAELEAAYYDARLREIENELETIGSSLDAIQLPHHVKELRSTSLQLLKAAIAGRYAGKQRERWKPSDLYRQSAAFLAAYPVVLSTTYSAKSCISPDHVFDYVIMDEASQVDIKTGALALSCATHAVIVGDDKQLPNVVGQEEATALRAIQETYQVEESYNAITHSFLKSCLEIFRDAPVTLLREHYRCHPQIIEFCNRKFYDRELVAMTADENEEKVLEVVYTGKGNYARGHLNQREIDVIKEEVMPQFSENESVGIITPYRLQAEEINKTLGKDIASTVHKFQGRECDAIILSMVDNVPTEFSDDANLLNVAISRAKTRLCVVTNENEKPQESILGQLIDYMKYNNCEETQSKLHSVFDLLYKSYTAERLAFEASHKKISEHLSENLVYDALTKAIEKLQWDNVAVLCHYPLSRLIADWNSLNEKEKAFAESPLAHVDFLVYNSLTKQPMQVFEVDGWQFHQNNEAQQSRDQLKDSLLTKFGLCPQRISTTDTFNVETCISMLFQRGQIEKKEEHPDCQNARLWRASNFAV